MLALTRKRGESIIIGDDVEVVILGIQGEQVKIGILAPKRVTVHRKEIYIQIQIENKEANAVAANVDLTPLKTIFRRRDDKSAEEKGGHMTVVETASGQAVDDKLE